MVVLYTSYLFSGIFGDSKGDHIVYQLHHKAKGIRGKKRRGLEGVREG